jgi:para-nitrobenzyl esterase
MLIRVLVCIATLLLSVTTQAQDPNFHIYLCLGQSNMEGFPGIPDEDKAYPNPRFQVLAAVDFPEQDRKKGQWYPAVPPLCRPNSGLSPSDFFGRTMVERLPADIKIGIVNVSVAGCRIEAFDGAHIDAYAATAPDWLKAMIDTYAGNPYQYLVDTAKRAQQDGVIKGILLHQGESNSGEADWPLKVKAVYENLLHDLGLNAAEVPLIAGELVDAQHGGKCADMNAIIATLPSVIPTAHVVSSADCPARSDGLHFTPEGYRILGQRYAETVLGLTATPPPPVATEYGLVQGATETDLTVYRGVPFAAPPVGDLRWRAPQPATPWDGVRAATAFAPDPYQGDGSGNVSEDCLYLNIWTPAHSSAEKLSVLVWIYGGGFSFGSTSTPIHDGQHLARKGVILISINYRVGPFGFLAHPELSAESPHGVSGNYGLLDQIAGLKWIQDNIAAFGGDPNQVTIFGESAGGIAVSMLCASPEAEGLFRGAISQSGGSFGPHRTTTYPGENMHLLADAEQAGVRLAARAGVDSIAAFRALAPDKLPGGFGSGAGWPIVDGWVIPDDQYKLYQNGRYNNVDILVGYNSDEGLSFSREKTPAEYEANVRQRYGPFADRLIAAYPAGDDNVPRTARNLMRDAAFGWQTWSWARLQSRASDSNVFLYYFDQHAERPADSPAADHGMPHGVDVPYVFQTLNRDDKNLTHGDWAISETVSTYWANFAKRGDPNGPGVPPWPAFSNTHPQAMHFHHTAYVSPVASEKSLLVLDQYFAWRRTPEGAAWAK